eukprot:910001-Rhodomonas_salina.1
MPVVAPPGRNPTTEEAPCALAPSRVELGPLVRRPTITMQWFQSGSPSSSTSFPSSSLLRLPASAYLFTVSGERDRS